MKIQITDLLNPQQKLRVIHLWNQEFPASLGYDTPAQFDEYLSKLDNISHYLAIDEYDIIKGWMAVFNRDKERWLALLIDSSAQSLGIGTHMLNAAKFNETELNGWVIDHDIYIKTDGKPYLSPLAFYSKNGFEVLKDVRFQNDKMNAVKIRWTKQTFSA